MNSLAGHTCSDRLHYTTPCSSQRLGLESPSACRLPLSTCIRAHCGPPQPVFRIPIFTGRPTSVLPWVCFKLYIIIFSPLHRNIPKPRWRLPEHTLGLTRLRAEECYLPEGEEPAGHHGPGIATEQTPSANEMK